MKKNIFYVLSYKKNISPKALSNGNMFAFTKKAIKEKRKSNWGFWIDNEEIYKITVEKI